MAKAIEKQLKEYFLEKKKYWFIDAFGNPIIVEVEDETTK